MYLPYSSDSFWQTNIWRDILIRSGYATEVNIFEYGEKKICIEFRNVGLGMIGAFSIGVRGNMYDENFFLNASDFVRRKGAIFYQIEMIDLPGEILSHFLLSRSKKIYRTFLEPWTRIIDLTKTEDEILLDMHEKCRYNINLSKKRGVEVQWVSPSQENIDTWIKILRDTTSRDGFHMNTRKYYEDFLRVLEEHNAGGLLFATFQSHVIAAGIFVYLGSFAIYYYGASVSESELRKHMAPYLLQWEAIREGKRRGCMYYDFLGIADPEDKDSPLIGVSEFKKRFGGMALQLGPKYLIPLSWRFLLFQMVQKIRKILKGMLPL